MVEEFEQINLEQLQEHKKSLEVSTKLILYKSVNLVSIIIFFHLETIPQECVASKFNFP